jgi:hypothetical protein
VEADSRIRAQLEQHVGRPVTDDEWELFKRLQLEQTKTDVALSAAPAGGWTGNQVAAFFAGLVAAFAGAGLLLEWDFVFSAGVRIPLGFLVLLTAVAGCGFLLRTWDFYTIFFGVLFFLLPFAIAGGALIFKDRRYLTSTQETVWGEGAPAELLGVGLLVASAVLLWVGRPRWAFLPKLLRLGAGVLLTAFAVYSIVVSDRPLAVTAAWLLGAGVALLTAGSRAEGPSARSALGSLAVVSALGLVAADLVVEGRPLEILLWVPLVLLAAVGSLLGLAALLGEGSWRIRIARVLVGLVLVASALGVAAALRVSPW